MRFVSHHKGVHERQIRTVKRIFLLAIQGPDAAVNGDVLSTAFHGIENTINSRQIVECRDDPRDKILVIESFVTSGWECAHHLA